MHACHSVSVACRLAETRQRCGEIGSVRRSILVGHQLPNGRQRVFMNTAAGLAFVRPFLSQVNSSFDITSCSPNLQTFHQLIFLHYNLPTTVLHTACSHNISVFIHSINSIFSRLKIKIHNSFLILINLWLLIYLKKKILCYVFSVKDEGHDLVHKRYSKLKLPYAIIDNDTPVLMLSSDEELNKIKPPNPNKKSQLRDYLQAGRKRKTPYREICHGLNSTYPSIIEACNRYKDTEFKPEFMFHRLGHSFAFDQNHFGYHEYVPAATGTSVECMAFDTTKYNNYANGYYFDTRQYTHSFQCHSRSYTDIMVNATPKHKSISKYSYDQLIDYGLDLSTRNHYNPSFVSDMQKNSDECCNGYDKISDPLMHTGALNNFVGSSPSCISRSFSCTDLQTPVAVLNSSTLATNIPVTYQSVSRQLKDVIRSDETFTADNTSKTNGYCTVICHSSKLHQNKSGIILLSDNAGYRSSNLPSLFVDSNNCNQSGVTALSSSSVINDGFDNHAKESEDILKCSKSTNQTTSVGYLTTSVIQMSARNR